MKIHVLLKLVCINIIEQCYCYYFARFFTETENKICIVRIKQNFLTYVPTYKVDMCI